MFAYVQPVTKMNESDGVKVCDIIGANSVCERNPSMHQAVRNIINIIKMRARSIDASKDADISFSVSSEISAGVSNFRISKYELLDQLECELCQHNGKRNLVYTAVAFEPATGVVSIRIVHDA